MNQEFPLAEIAQALNVTKRSAERRANREAWPFEERTVRGGRRRHYLLHKLPTNVQRAIIAKHGAPDIVTDQEEVDAGDRAAALWAWFERLPDKTKDVARRRADLLVRVEDLVSHGMGRTKAREQVGAIEGESSRTIENWHRKVKGQPRDQWLPLLAPGWTGRTATAECSPEAWEAFKADYLRRAQPTAAACYKRIQRIAAAEGWAWPAKRTVLRWVDERIPRATRILAREGQDALDRLMPALDRDHTTFHALEAINGDGYDCKIKCRWPDGSVARAVIWWWQDIRSGKMLTWRVDVSENTDLIRLTYGDLIEQYGIPPIAYIDNTTAASNKWMTGRTKVRFRYKLKDEDPLGIMPQVGTDVRFVTPGHGQSKPIERAHRDFRDLLDRHPAFADRGTEAKPVPIDEFLQVLETEVRAYNADTDRRGKHFPGRSFDDVFNESYQHAEIRRATAEQRRLWLLCAEKVRANKESGMIKLGRSATGENRYWTASLAEYAGQLLVVRFDPERLHEAVHVYTLDGRYICAADCTWQGGFADTTTARAYHRERRRYKRHTKRALESQRRMKAAAVADRIPQPDPEDTPHPKIVRGRFGNSSVEELGSGQIVDTETGEIQDEETADERYRFGDLMQAAHRKFVEENG